MSILEDVTSGTIKAPYKVTLYGVEGVGKSTFASEADAPIFLCSEDGTEHLDVRRLPQPKTWDAVLQCVDTLTEEQHDYKTFVVDTLDWMEPLLLDATCKQHGWKNIDEPGYGKGPNAALQEWRVFLARLERMRKTKGIHILLLGHSEIKSFRNPDGEDFDRYQMKLQPRASGLIREWSDCVLFATFETVTKKQGGRHRGITTGARIIHAERRAAWEAKNRYTLPAHLPLSFQEFNAARTTNNADQVGELEDILAQLTKIEREKAINWIDKQTDKQLAIAKVIDRARAKLVIKGEDND